MLQLNAFGNADVLFLDTLRAAGNILTNSEGVNYKACNGDNRLEAGLLVVAGTECEASREVVRWKGSEDVRAR
jgi:hypothetical protein